MTIIHISTDYPDACNPYKTQAVRNLVDAASVPFDNFIYSLNRIDISPLRAVKDRLGGGADSFQRRVIESGSDIMACWTYQAPSKGLYLKSTMTMLADLISEDIIRRRLKPALIQGHKLSMEGIIAHRVAQNIGIPYALSVQGNSDRTILQIRRDLWPLYRAIYHGAAIIFPFTPWAHDYLEKTLGHRTGPVEMMPCITSQDQIITPKETPPRIISAFHLKQWKLKNLAALAKAARHIGASVPNFACTVYGGGALADVTAARNALARFGNPHISLGGPVAHQAMQPLMNRAAGFAMLSKKESFGMVFIEALLAGCPVVYPQDAAIDGYFDDHDFAIAAPAGDQAAINAAMAKLVHDQSRLKKALHIWQQQGGPAFFQQGLISTRYIAGLKTAMQDAI